MKKEELLKHLEERKEFTQKLYDISCDIAQQLIDTKEERELTEQEKFTLNNAMDNMKMCLTTLEEQQTIICMIKGVEI